MIDIYSTAGELIMKVSNTDFRWGTKKKLSGANFSGQVLEGIYFDDSDLVGADFSESDLYNASLHCVIADRANFTKASLRGAHFFMASLQGALFINADLSPDNMEGITSMVRCDLRGADLTGADITRVCFDGSFYNERTKFPQNLDPARIGMLPKI